MKNLDLETFQLKAGKHESIDEGGCVMEIVSYIAGEPWSDHPKCTCPVLTGYATSLNDKCTDSERQLIKPLIPKLVNTRDGKAKTRAEFFVLCIITRILPILTDSLNLLEISTRLRSFKHGEWVEVRDYINEKKSEIRSAADAAAVYADATTYADSDVDAAAADATAADATYAYAAAYAYAYADAYADAADPKNKNWKEVRAAIIAERIKILEEAIAL